MSRKARKFKAFFRPKFGDLQKKKKKRVFAKIQSNFSAEIRDSKVFFCPKLVDLQKKKKKKKKKKGLHPKLRLLFRPVSQIQTFEGGCFRMWGAIFHFSHKIGLKSTKSMRFCILHKSMGGGARAPPAPPPPPLATLLQTGKTGKHLSSKI